MNKQSLQSQNFKDDFAGGRTGAPFWRPALLALFLLAIPFLLYQKTGRFDFVNWDDSFHVYENPSIRSWDLENISAWFKKPFVSLYIPVPMASFAADYHFSGNDPSGFHRTNLMIHLFSTFLVFLLFRFFFKENTTAFLGALLFSAHPLQAETVSWISARKTLLCGFFSLLTFLWFLKKDRNKFFFWPVLTLLYAAALLSKITAIMLLPVFFLHSYLFGTLKVEKKYLWLLWILAAAVLALTLPLYSKFFSNYHARGFSELGFYPLLRAGIYLKNAFYPNALRLFYPLNFYPISKAVPLCAGSAVFLAATLWGFSRRAVFSFWLLWMWLWLLPVLTLLAVPVADHHFYLPLIGLIGAVLALTPYSKKIVYGFLIAANLACLPLTARQIPVWENSGTLWSHYLRFDALDYRASMQLADFYQSHGKVPEAAAVYEKLTASWTQLPNAYMNLGNLYLASGNLQKAEETAARFEKNIPGHAYPFLIRGLSAQMSGKENEAENFFKNAQNLAPSDSLVLMDLGRFYLRQKKMPEAVSFFEKATDSSSAAEAYYYLGLIQNAGGDWQKALDYFHAMHLKSLYFQGSSFQEAYANLKLSRRGEAEKLYLKSIHTDPDRTEAWLHLGLMLYQDGRLKEALPLLQTAAGKRPGDTKTESLISNIQQRLKNA